jgi:hypothetical protein
VNEFPTDDISCPIISYEAKEYLKALLPNEIT